MNKEAKYVKKCWCQDDSSDDDIDVDGGNAAVFDLNANGNISSSSSSGSSDSDSDVKMIIVIFYQINIIKIGTIYQTTKHGARRKIFMAKMTLTMHKIARMKRWWSRKHRDYKRRSS